MPVPPPPDPTRRRLLKALAAAITAGPAISSADGREHLWRFPLSDGDERLVGDNHIALTGEDETLHDVARRFDVGYWDILLANPGVDFWLPGNGTPVVIPRRYILPDAPRRGIVINAAELRLYYYPDRSDSEREVITHPIGIGRQDWGTPAGHATVTEKIPQPAWYPPASIRAEAAAKGESLPRVVPPGADNPLGEYALILDLPGYLIHGTNRPAGVGMRVSHGCVRLYPEDIATLFPRVERGTPVRIVNQPIKHTWNAGQLWVEAHPLPATEDYTSEDLRFGDAERRRLARALTSIAISHGQLPDRGRLRTLLERPSGVPTAITR